MQPYVTPHTIEALWTRLESVGVGRLYYVGHPGDSGRHGIVQDRLSDVYYVGHPGDGGRHWIVQDRLSDGSQAEHGYTTHEAYLVARALLGGFNAPH